MHTSLNLCPYTPTNPPQQTATASPCYLALRLSACSCTADAPPSAPREWHWLVLGSTSREGQGCTTISCMSCRPAHLHEQFTLCRACRASQLQHMPWPQLDMGINEWQASDEGLPALAPKEFSCILVWSDPSSQRCRLLQQQLLHLVD